MRDDSPPPPRNARWEAVTVAAIFAFGGGLVSMVLVGLTALLVGPGFDWSLVSGFVTVCAIAVALGLPVLIIDRLKHREKN